MKTRILVGETVDQRYDIVEVMEDAGSGVICRAVDRNSGDKAVVLKVMHADLSSVPLERERFIRQGGLALKDDRGKLVSHVVGSGLIDNCVPYMAVEDIPGKSLKDLLKESPEGLDPDFALRIGLKICDALKDLHSRNVVHRDLRPAIITLVNEDPDNVEVRILEFGLARFIETSRRPDSLTKTGMIIGTLAEYMAPEQCKGFVVDERADIYAAGCILYEMFTGEPPFSGNASVEIMSRHLSFAPPDLSEKQCAKKYPRLEQVLWRALAKDRNERYFSAEDFAADLSALLCNSELMPFKPARTQIVKEEDLQRPSEGIRWWLPPVILSVVALIGWGAWQSSDFSIANSSGAIERLKQTVRTAPGFKAVSYLHDLVPDSQFRKYPRALLSICIENADRCCAAKRYHGAIKIMERYLTSAKDPECLLIARAKLGDIYSRIGSYKLAIPNLEGVLKNESHSQISANLSIACMLGLARSENLSNGMQIYQEILKRNDLTRFERLVIARKVANDLILQGFKKEAMTTLSDALNRAPVNNVPPDNNVVLTRQLNSAAVDLCTMQVSSNPELALQCADDLLARNTLNPEQTFRVLLVRGTAYELMNDLKRAEQTFEASLEHRSNATYQSQQEVLMALYRLQIAGGNTASAAKYRKEAYDLAAKALDPMGMGEAAPLSATDSSGTSASKGDGQWSIIGDTKDFEVGETRNLPLVQEHLVAEFKGKQAKVFVASELRQIQDDRWKKAAEELQK